MRVELDVYSGRPNPTFEMNGSDSERLIAIMKSLPSATTPVPEGGLGYRGFLINDTVGSVAGSPQRIRIFAGHVAMEHGGKTSVYQDAHNTENWLKELAGRAGYGALFQ